MDKPREGYEGFFAAPRFGRGENTDTLEDFRDKISSHLACQLFDYWTGLIHEHGDQVKHLVDPTAFPALLPAIYIEEWDQETQQSRIRLAGEFHRELAGMPVIGLTADQHTHPAQAQIWKQCDQLNFIDHAATLSHYSLWHVQDIYRWIWDLSLPIADRNGNWYVLGYVWVP